jgi:hypothetical protein
VLQKTQLDAGCDPTFFFSSLKKHFDGRRNALDKEEGLKKKGINRRSYF